MSDSTVRRVWVPFERSLKDIPDGLVADFFDGTGAAPDSIGEVELYVVPYLFQHANAELIARMPKLKVVQPLTAGVDHVRPYVPPGVTLCNARGLHDASTAELAVTLTLSALRSIPAYVRAAEHASWAPTYASGAVAAAPAH